MLSFVRLLSSGQACTAREAAPAGMQARGISGKGHITVPNEHKASLLPHDASPSCCSMHMTMRGVFR